MKTWYVTFEHKNEENKGRTRGYMVVAEDDDMAEHVARESLENDEKNWDPRPHRWNVKYVNLLEICRGCGGMRVVAAPSGSGAVPCR